MKKLLITGANGQLGKSFSQLQSIYPDINIELLGREALDITDRDLLRKYFEQQELIGCINCAAYTAVDRAEEETKLAELVNTKAPEWLATLCAERAIPFVHYSTDYVYHNGQNRPLRETDATNPQGVYARTKLEGELAARSVYSAAITLRTSWVYAPYGHNFVNTMLRLGKERDHLNVVFDQIGTPTFAPDLAKATMDMVRSALLSNHLDPLGGVYHYSNEGVCSWYDFALAIFELSGVDCSVSPIESSQYPTPAKRPAFSVMNKNKIKNAFDLTIPHWRESLKRCLSEMGKLASN